MDEEVRPFQRQGHYTVFDNAILDALMPRLSANAWKVLSFILRQTVGWQKDEDALSYSQLQQGTGIKHPATINRAINELADEGVIVVTETSKWEPTRYRVNRAYTLPATKNEPASKSEVEPTSKSESAPTSKNEDTKQSNTKEEGEADPITELAGYFTQLTGLMPNGGTWHDDWELPLTVWHKRAGIDGARELIERGVTFARSGAKRRYTLKAPSSLTTIIANLPDEASNGSVVEVGFR